MAALRGCRRQLMTRFLLPLLALLLSGCVAHTPMAATDGAALDDESADAKSCTSIRSALLARHPGVLSVLTIFCRNQLVVIAGALPPDYKPAVEAVHIATKTPGVRRVETVFVPKAAQKESDAAVAARIRTALAGDANTRGPGTDLTVVAGTVVLVGMVDDQAKADRIIAGAASVEGVRSVRSFIQLRP
jgi:osmotically-inducible protein OsmY